MEYSYNQTENGKIIVVNNIIFMLDSQDEIHVKMITDFEDTAKLEYFVSLLKADPSTAFTIYNSPR